MRKRKTFSLLLSLLFALTLVPVTGGTAKAEKPVIDTIIITNTDIRDLNINKKYKLIDLKEEAHV